jgi:hypothetical protein
VVQLNAFGIEIGELALTEVAHIYLPPDEVNSVRRMAGAKRIPKRVQ